MVKNLPADAGEANLIPVWGRSPGVGNATLLTLALPLTPNPNPNVLAWGISWKEEPGGP